MTAVPLCVQLVVPAGATVLSSLPRHADPSLAAAGAAGGSEVVLVAHRTVDAVCLHRRARRLGLVVERDFVVLPSLRRPWCCVELDGGGLSWLWQTLGTVPPGWTVAAPALQLALRVGRHSRIVSLAARVAPGRVVLGRWA